MDRPILLRALLTSLLLFFGAARPAFAANPAPAAGATLPLDADGRLPLPEAIRLLLARNFSIQIQDYEVLISHDDVKKAQGAFDPKLFASTSYDDNERKLNAIDFSSFGLSAADPKSALYKEQDLRSAGGINGKLPFTGTQYELSMTLDRLKNDVNRAGRYYYPEYQSFAGLTLTQPLLKGLWYGSANADVNVARYSVHIAERTREIEVVNKLVEFLDAYYDMIFGLENQKVKEDALAIARKLRDDNEKRHSVGKMSSLDVTQAEVKMSEASEEVILAEDFLRERRMRVLKMLLRDFTPGAISAFSAEADLAIAPAERQAAAEAERALELRPDYLLSLEQIKHDGVVARAARSDRLPQLDLQFSYGRTGLNDSTYSSFSEVYDQNHQKLSAGAVLQMPIGNRTAAATERNARRRQQEAQLKSDELRTTIRIEVSNAIERMAALQRRLENATHSRELAAAGLNVELNRLEAGQTTSFNVLDLQQKSSEARTREIAARVDLKKAEAELWAATGQLPTQLGLTIVPVNAPKRY